MTKRSGWWWLSLGLVVVVGAGGAGAQSARTKTRPAAPAAKAPATRSGARTGAVAMVGGVPIPRAAFEERVRLAEENYRERTGNLPAADDRQILRRQVLEGMIREKLLLLEARRRGMTLTTAQAEEEVKKDPFFQSGGMFDEAKYLAIKASQPERFRSVLADLQSTVPAIRLRERLQRENAPDSSALRDRLASEMSTVRIHYLALRRGDFDGQIPPPSEAEVLAYYHDHANDFRQPEQVRVSVLTVNQPPLDQSLRANEAERKAWEARMERRADSLLAALKGGAPLEGVAPLYGGVRNETLLRDRFPRYWMAGDKSRDEVFSTAAGVLLPTSIPAAEGRILVRVDEHVPARVAPLREVASTIRSTLRNRAAQAADDRDLRALYTAMRDSLRGDAYHVRYAVADTATFPVPEPSQAELDRYYRGHQADYATLDRATTSVVTLPFSQVRGDVRLRMLRERRVQAARNAAEQLQQVWAAGKRDARLERLMNARDVGPVPMGGAVYGGDVGALLTDSLSTRRRTDGGTFWSVRGPVIYRIHDRVRDYVPSFEASRPVLASHLEARRQAADEVAAKALFGSKPQRFHGGNVVHFSRLMVSPPPVLAVPLSRTEVESWYHNHSERYGAPELTRVRHILLVPQGAGPEADAAAKKLADDVMRRLRAGEDFGKLALQYSDDDETKSQGGDVGVFRPGMMLPDFERVALSMDVGELRGPVRIQAGYEIMECLLHVPAEMVPLKYCYSNVAVDAARSKSRLIARFRADSILRTIHTIAQARAAARQSKYVLYQNEHVVGTPMPRDIQDYIHGIEKTPAGRVYPEVQEYVGMGYAVSWVDSVLPPRAGSWRDSRDQAIAMFEDQRIRQRMAVKRSELDSLFHAGWSFDSVAALWNGPEEHGPTGPGNALPKLGGAEVLDSLAFGGRGKSPVLRPLVVSDWVELPGGLVRLRLMERHPPDPAMLGARFENDYRAQLERNFRSVFEKIRRHFPVEILDPDLRLVDLPSLEAS